MDLSRFTLWSSMPIVSRFNFQYGLTTNVCYLFKSNTSHLKQRERWIQTVHIFRLLWFVTYNFHLLTLLSLLLLETFLPIIPIWAPIGAMMSTFSFNMNLSPLLKTDHNEYGSNYPTKALIGWSQKKISGKKPESRNAWKKDIFWNHWSILLVQDEIIMKIIYQWDFEKRNY